VNRLAYVDMVGGAAGDMLLGAWIDAGADAAAIEAALRTIVPDGWTMTTSRTVRAGIAATRCVVDVPGEDQPGGHGHGRHFADVLAIVDRSGLSAKQKARASAIYRRLAEAEARVHGTSVEAVHFHEVGALDAILDVAGTCVALDLLGIDAVSCSAFPTGRGMVRMAHGLFPNPPPATAAMLVGAPLRDVEIDAELVTPTAAAILTALVAEPGKRPSLRLLATGYGAGSRDLAVPNVVRVLIGEATTASGATGDEPNTISVLECNLDDMSPQHFALAIERITDAGARDVWTTAIGMKKGRPATLLSAIARPEDEAAVAAAMLRETTTIGVRVRSERKYVLERRIVEVATPLGPIRVKVAGSNGNSRALAEHDDVVRLAREHDLPAPEVSKLVQPYADGVAKHG
jgi:uncharacterized protein (TIGR00299 family) protein